MRQVILDTETTGLDPSQGHRVIEIGCVEIVNRRRTGRTLQYYLNPEREIEDGAYSVHGISNEDLKDKPRFSEIAQELIDFIRDAEVIIHNAPFDVEFINAELGIVGENWGVLPDYCEITDTLVMARELHPGQKNSLDALCTRYEVDNSQRDLHGALLDAQILLDVYLAMTGGQTDLQLDPSRDEQKDSDVLPVQRQRNFKLRVIEATEDELEAHEKMLDRMSEQSGTEPIWRKISD